MRFHARVHQRLRVTGFVRLVVAELSESHHVQHHVFIELLTVIKRDSQRPVSCFGIVAVDMEDGQLRHAGHVSRVDC